MPPHDETSAVAPRGGSVRRPPAARASAASGGGSGRPAAGRGRPASSRGGEAARSSAASRGAGSARSAGAGSARSAGGGSARSAGSGGSRPGGGGSRPGGGGRPPGSRPPARGASAGGGGKKKGGKKQRRRRILAAIAATLVGALVLLGVFVGVVYASTEVPSADAVTSKQTTILYYSDGVTEMARLGKENRTNVGLQQVAEPARQAVLAAENRSFYTDPGISVTGIARAAWNNLTGGSTQGGSTITQQYVKNAFLTADQTFTRKFKELFLAVKLDNQYTKDEILENYLNTIYFGRGAYGIETAANTYFGVPAAQLTAEQGAVLAVLIRNPSSNDPATNPEGAQSRWGLVLDAMVQQGWLDGTARAAMQYPAVLPKTGSTLGTPSGPDGLIVKQVENELQGNYPDLQSQGLRITTTINKGYQDAAVAAVDDVMKGEDPALRQALVAVDPKTGGVVAYYGNAQTDGEDTTDYAQAYKPPGSSFKPYTLATALEQGISVDARRDGTSPQTFKDRTKPVVNSGNAQCAACTLTEAITRSLNTTFYGLAYEVGPSKVATTARAAMGMPDSFAADDLSVPKDLRGFPTLTSTEGHQTGGAIGIGEYPVRPIDQAVGFATLANEGMYHQRHFVAQIADASGAVRQTVDGSNGAQQVIPADVANDVTFALEGVAKYSKRALDGNRQVASKTGTQGLNNSDNSDAWMVGYTPSLSTAVWMGTKGAAPIVNAQDRIIYGAGLPGAIWQEFMNKALAGTPKEPLPSKSIIKGDTGKSVAAPTTAAPETSASPSTSSTRAPATTTKRTPASTSAADTGTETQSDSTTDGNSTDTAAPTATAGARWRQTSSAPAGQ